MAIDKMLTAANVAEIFQVKPMQVCRWVHAGKMRGLKLGKGFRFLPSEVVDIQKNGFHDAATNYIPISRPRHAGTEARLWRNPAK
jgi:excisionase family DNA binding protein